MPKPFINPYAQDRDNDVRIMSLIPKRKWEYIRRLSLRHGTMVTTINILIDKLITACEQHRVIEQSAYEYLVANSELCIGTMPCSESGSNIESHPREDNKLPESSGTPSVPGRAIEVPNTGTYPPNVGRPTTGQGVPMEGTPHVVNDSSSSVGRGSQGTLNPVTQSKKAVRSGRSVKGV